MRVDYRLALCALVVFPMSTGFAQDLSGQEILDGLNVPEKDRQALVNGGVLAYDGEQYENTDRELAADAMVLIDRTLDEIQAQIQEVPTIIPEKYVEKYEDIDEPGDFDAVAFEDGDYDEVERLFKAKPGKDFNFSQEEFAALAEMQKQGRGLDRAGKIEAASEFIRGVLKSRYESYRENGLGGIPSYWRSKRKIIDIGSELRMSTETLDPLEGEFLEYYNMLLDYPEGEDCCEHIHRWMRVKLRKRPTYALAHTMIERRENHLVVTERHYFVTHTLNSTQITIAWLPFEEGTHMGLAISASTDVLDSLMGRMLRGVGRGKARELVSDTLTQIRDDLEAAEASAE